MAVVVESCADDVSDTVNLMRMKPPTKGVGAEDCTEKFNRVRFGSESVQGERNQDVVVCSDVQ